MNQHEKMQKQLPGEAPLEPDDDDLSLMDTETRCTMAPSIARTFYSNFSMGGGFIKRWSKKIQKISRVSLNPRSHFYLQMIRDVVRVEKSHKFCKLDKKLIRDFHIATCKNSESRSILQIIKGREQRMKCKALAMRKAMTVEDE